MLKRDLPTDYCERYLDQASKQTFYNELQTGNQRDNLYLTSRQLNILGEESKKTTRMIQGIGAVSILTFIMFKKLPLFAKIQSRPMKIITRLGILFGPALGVFNFQIQKIQQLKNLIYEEQGPKYTNFLRCGDFKQLSPDIEFCDH